ncbi:MAG: SelL-related redox protein [Saprospiraceae bacterium]
MRSSVQALENISTVNGQNLLEISQSKKVLLIFLRHFGCSFCREALAEIHRIDEAKKHKNFEIILVHMAAEDVAFDYFKKFNISNLDHISDPECHLYDAFGLTKANFNQLFGFRSWIRGIETGIIKGHGWGMQLGDGFQMPGIFTISKGKIISEFRHKFPSDKPDYEKLISCRKV